MKPVIVEGRINGIDLCSIQDAVPINYKAVADAGFHFAYVKCSQYSSTRDHKYRKLVDGLLSAGLRVGAYHFCAHDTDPERQAEFFFRASEGLGQKAGELPPMMDWEFCTPSKYPNHPKHCVTWIKKFARKVTELWYPDNAHRRIPRLPVLYSYPNYCGTHQPALSEEVELGEFPLCYASYKSKPNGKGSYELVPWLPSPEQGPLHAIPKPFTRWTLWQYSGDKGLRVPGISVDCDRQLFNGSQGDWAEFLGMIRPVHQTEKDVIDDVS